MDFNLANPWQDTSGQGAAVSCPSGYCPSVSEGSATFNGGQFLTASGSVPNLSGGRLTLSAWIYPQNRDSNETWGYYWYQGILGNHILGGATGYPTLDRLGLKLRFGFSTGTEWKEFSTSTDVLTLDAWNHVVVTYSQDDGYVRFYVNGVLKGSSNAGKYASIASPASFFIGRSTDQTKLTAVSARVNATSDAGVKCPYLYASNDPDELCLASHNPEVGSPAQALRAQAVQVQPCLVDQQIGHPHRPRRHRAGHGKTMEACFVGLSVTATTTAARSPTTTSPGTRWATAIVRSHLQHREGRWPFRHEVGQRLRPVRRQDRQCAGVQPGAECGGG
jgi:hypothetical protein